VKADVRYETYPIVGSTFEQVRQALALLAPVHDGTRFGAYTRWNVVWCIDPATRRTDVRVEAVVTLPRLELARGATRNFTAEWVRYLDALRRHEQGHVAIAETAGSAVASALEALRQSHRGWDDHAARGVVEDVMRHHRALERHYDERTRHGATEGVVLPAH
jgi:predicted secreted Zn-dependent protease